jgi:hypothetical protein
MPGAPRDRPNVPDPVFGNNGPARFNRDIAIMRCRPDAAPAAHHFREITESAIVPMGKPWHGVC